MFSQFKKYISLAIGCVHFPLNSDINIYILSHPLLYNMAKPQIELVTRKCDVSGFMEKRIKRSWTEQDEKLVIVLKSHLLKAGILAP